MKYLTDDKDPVRFTESIKLGSELENVLNKYAEDKKLYVADFLSILGILYVSFVRDAAFESPPDEAQTLKSTSVAFIQRLIDSIDGGVPLDG